MFAHMHVHGFSHQLVMHVYKNSQISHLGQLRVRSGYAHAVMCCGPSLRIALLCNAVDHSIIIYIRFCI